MQSTFTFFCPIFATGGTEAIHQASMAFNQLGARSQIAYYGQGAQLARHQNEVVCLNPRDNICLEKFAAYKPVIASRIDLHPSNVLIAPEINAFEFVNFLPSRFVVWWLSVDNAIAHNPQLRDEKERAAFFTTAGVGHWFQSEYARRFLLANGAGSMHALTDFTDPIFMPDPKAVPNAGHKILYNKKKGAALADRFFGANPDLEPLALDGMSKADLAATYAQHAIYVDFGSLPGKDRMPREAAACGCVIFVHRQGAGRELGDFPVHEAFRFDVGDVENGGLAARIRTVLADRRPAWAMQSHIRDVIRQEPSAFVNEAKLILEAEARNATPASVTTVVAGSDDASSDDARIRSRKGAVAFAEGWEAARHRYCLWCVTPDNYSHTQAFDEVMTTLSEAFATLGGSAPVTRHPSQWAGRIPIVFGGHLLSSDSIDRLPPGSIVFNLEQVDDRSRWLSEAYILLLERYAVLDYSARNTAALKTLGYVNARHLPIGAMPGLERIPRIEDKDIDVLFYGSLNERRAKVLDALRARGLKVEHLFGVYGHQRDAAIARAKVVLNLHYYASAIFESVRVSYLLANGCCVVSEGDLHDPDVTSVRDGMAICAYEDLVERCVALVRDSGERDRLSAAGRRLMTGRRQSDYLAALFADGSVFEAEDRTTPCAKRVA